MRTDLYPGFLESEVGIMDPNDALFHIIPAPYEKSVSYGTGTAQGPSAILRASQQLELFDGVDIPAECGIHTLAMIECEGTRDAALNHIRKTIEAVLDRNKIPVLLGGEHTVTVGALRALQHRYAPDKIGIVQFDAHADLRDTYEGSPLSHACVMHRALDMGFDIYQIGIRSLSYEEACLRREKGIGHLDARRIATAGFPDPILPAGFPSTVYLTIDVDGLDPSVIAATGTPEPGGLNWYQMMYALETIVAHHEVVGFDVVELAPIPGLHAADYAAARLIYNTMGIIRRHHHAERR